VRQLTAPFLFAAPFCSAAPRPTGASLRRREKKIKDDGASVSRVIYEAAYI